MIVSIDAHHLLGDVRLTNDFIFEPKDVHTLVRVAAMVRSVTGGRFRVIGWCDADDTHADTWCRFRAEFASDEEAVRFSMVWL
jgi:hypothetical protein